MNESVCAPTDLVKGTMSSPWLHQRTDSEWDSESFFSGSSNKMFHGDFDQMILNYFSGGMNLSFSKGIHSCTLDTIFNPKKSCAPALAANLS